ncbi:hypothetical protein Pcinc_021573 [Petrolisthes cinctipes]|uniref:Uncharacterized protein n=1 Tax=Petrolisthes cinctipes TaxID=88211 RepID=A0AAE1KI44_PETCI|nr:hypothetical protein Pcinc_021573 [Petrolisthes cinctipes]
MQEIRGKLMLGIRTEGCKNGGVMETEENEKEKKVDGGRGFGYPKITLPQIFHPSSPHYTTSLLALPYIILTSITGDEKDDQTPSIARSPLAPPLHHPTHPPTPSSSTDTRVANKFPRTFMEEELKASDPTSLTLN